MSSAFTAQVLGAATAGTAFAAAVNAGLIAEDTRQALTAYQAPLPAASDTRICDQVMRRVLCGRGMRRTPAPR
jgi:hypothetical protein